MEKNYQLLYEIALIEIQEMQERLIEYRRLYLEKFKELEELKELLEKNEEK